MTTDETLIHNNGDPATQIRELFDSVNKILAENGQPEPTIEEICAYVDAVREERMNRTNVTG